LQHSAPLTDGVNWFILIIKV